MHRSLLLLLASASLCLANINDYELIPSHGYYRYSSVKKTWDEAQAECEEEGGFLAVLNSPAEAAAVKSFYNRKRRSGDGITAHIGFQDREAEGQYKTVTGVNLDSAGYNVWKYPPTGSSANQVQDCGGLIICGRLTEMNCSDKATFICELSLRDERDGDVAPE